MGRGCRQEEAGGCGPVPAAVVVIFASFLSNLLFNGVSYCSGIFFANFLETFNAGTSATAGVISLQNCSLYFAGCVAGPLIARYGARLVAVLGSLVATAALIATAFATSVNYLYISFGVSAGFGFGLINLANLVVVQQHTTRRRVLAAALAMTGCVLGAFILPFLVRWSISTYGWHGCQLVLAGVVLHCLPCAMLTRSPPKSTVRADGQTTPMGDFPAKSTTADNDLALQKPKRTLLKCCSPMKRATKSSPSVDMKANLLFITDPACLLCAISNFFRCGGVTILYTYLPSKAMLEGLTTYRATMLISVVSIGEMIGRLGAGFIGTTREYLPAPIFIGSMILCGGMTMTIGYCHSYSSFIGVSAIGGIAFGANTATSSTVVRDVVGLQQYPKVLGLSLAMGGLGSMAAIQIFALLWEVTNSMKPSFCAGGAFRLLSAMAMVAVLALKRYGKQTNSTRELKVIADDDDRLPGGDLVSNSPEKGTTPPRSSIERIS